MRCARGRIRSGWLDLAPQFAASCSRSCHGSQLARPRSFRLLLIFDIKKATIPESQPMHPSVHARSNPDKAAIIVAEAGEAISYGELDAASNRAAQLARSHGLGHEDIVAFMLDNTHSLPQADLGRAARGAALCRISSRLSAGTRPTISSKIRARRSSSCRRASRGAAQQLDRDQALRHGRRHPPRMRQLGRCGCRDARYARWATSAPGSTCSIRRAPPAGRRACAYPFARGSRDRRGEQPRHARLAPAVFQINADGHLSVARAALSCRTAYAGGR